MIHGAMVKALKQPICERSSRMKTEFLKELGLEQEAIDKVMAENGKDIAAEKAKLTKAEGERDNYKTQLETAKEALGKFDGVDVEALKKQIADLEGDLKKKDEEYAAKEAERTFNETLSGAITAAGGKNAKAIMAMLDLETLKSSKDQSKDIAAAIEAVKKSDAYMFGSNEPMKNAVGRTGGDGGNGNETDFSAMRALMGLEAEKK